MPKNTKHNFIIILISNFIVAASATMIMPFLSLYIDTLGNFSESYVQTWAGPIFAATFITALIMSPIWGRIADKYGYKPIMMINCIGIATLLILAVVFILPQAFVTELWQLMLLSFLFGIVSGGLIPITTALIRREAPIEVQGEIMGYSQSFRFFGNIIGPVLGGYVASIGGIHSVFYTTGLLFLIAFVVMYFLRKLPIQYMDELLKNHA